jgi:hypothetical protein
MKTSFTLTASDFGRMQKVVLRRFRKKLGLFSVQFLLRVLVWMCIGFAGAAFARLIRENPEIAGSLETVALLVAFALLAIVAMPYLSQALFRKHMLAPNGSFLSPQTIELTASSVLVSSAVGNIELPWAGVLARDEDDENYYLFIDAMQALVLPREAVASSVAEFEQYTAHLKNAA